MSGHSKWHSIKHKKAAIDAKRGNIFTKIIKELTVAARIGGGNAESNSRLRLAISKAKENNMPQDNITRAIKKGTGELPGVSYEDFTYEGYGPGGVAMLVTVTTDNKNRTVSEVRHLFSRFNGNMGEAGCVAWMFHKKGMLVVDKTTADEEELLMQALDAGAEDVKTETNTYDILTAPEDLETVKEKLEKQGITFTLAEITMVPQTTIKLEGKDAQQMLTLMEKLEEHDDIQNVYANFDISEEELAKCE
ncbi:MAG: YebC/PmpR family DNA-binding transcriptional regulator [Candidatus Schekmanbacteria bacterium]|nr:YebC/PmpR family DNA-binding transcriptional regulator [Candidatus Schekmanbacteria bacterium]